MFLNEKHKWTMELSQPDLLFIVWMRGAMGHLVPPSLVDAFESTQLMSVPPSGPSLNIYIIYIISAVFLGLRGFVLLNNGIMHLPAKVTVSTR